MKKKTIIKKLGPISLATVMSFTGIYGTNFNLVTVHAEESSTSLGSITNVEKDGKNTVLITYANGYKGKFTFLENGIFRFNVDPKGNFEQYATPNSKDHIGKIQQQPDDSAEYSKPEATITDGEIITITAGNTKIELNKATTLMSVKRASDNSVVFSESEPLTIGAGETAQKLASSEDEYFYGGGTQNGRFSHKGQSIDIVNTNNWVDGGVASPNPFYWSTKGYGVLRNTFAPGKYDFAKGTTDVVTTHEEKEFDAYYFVADDGNIAEKSEEVLNDYFKVTGNPVLLPEYAFYLGHLNCYNRDGWNTTQTDATLKNGKQGGHSQWTLEDGNKYWENGLTDGYLLKPDAYAETLNGTGPSVLADNFKAMMGEEAKKFSAQAVIDGHVDEDMPLGWFLPNDGYGCGYGQNGYEYSGGTMADKTKAIDANVENLKTFTEYAKTQGVTTGLWTQSQLTPSESTTMEYQKLRDFNKEVKVGGITSLKTDVAWVGSGYSFGLDGISRAYDIVTETNNRPNIVTLDGWAGTQRYGSIWTGDQYGGDWEYIRFHIPTYIGQSLSGNPNIGSDMDGIFGGKNIIATRDYQWKTFTPQELDMDGWGKLAKKPYEAGDPYTSINRMYLKMKAELMPYTYSYAKEATSGLPMIRAMFLEYPDDANAYSKRSTEYQYMFGENFLVAPVYEDVDADENGNDVRNGIYLPDENQIWIDYFTGKQYKGGQTINNFDAPIWKLPLFVKNGSIVPMYEENNNPQAKTDTNTMGLDKTKRVVEFWPEGTTNFQLYEDDGNYVDNSNKEEVNYGGSVLTNFTSVVEGTTATLTAEKSTGNYDGYDSNRLTTFVVNVSKEPESLTAKNGDTTVTLKKAASQEEFDKDTTGNIYYYNEAPDLNKYTMEDEGFHTKIQTNPKLYVKFARTNVTSNEQQLVISGFENNAEFSKNEENLALAAPVLENNEDALTPTSVSLHWNNIDDATYYEVSADGNLVNVNDELSYLDKGLDYHSSHTYKVRARNLDGYSKWSNELTIQTLDDPWRNVPEQKITWNYGDQWGALANANDKNFNSMFHSTGDAIGKDLIIDLGSAYQLDKLEYYPRGAGQSGDGAISQNANGMIKQMDVSVSMDGKHWTKIQDGATTPEWTYVNGASIKDSVKTVSLDKNAARYVKVTAIKSAGNFFSTNGLYVHKKDGSTGFAVGSNLNKPTVTEGDYTNMNQYVGVSKFYNASTFDSQIKAHYADINNNDVYDAYDYAFTMFNLDGGTKKTGSVSGNMLFIPSVTSVKAGETFTIDVYGNDMKNVNGFGGLITYDQSQISVNDVKVALNPSAASMDNLTVNSPFNSGENADKLAMLNIAFLNKGDKALLSGNHTIATISMKAKEDMDLSINTANSLLTIENAMLMGPDFSTVDAQISDAPEVPETPAEKETKLGLQDVTMTMTNEALPTDNGKNVETLIHSKNYDGLFTDTKNDFEFMWDVESSYDADVHKLPVTLHAALKQEQTISNIVLVNRDGLGRGAVGGVTYQITYADNSIETKEITGVVADYSYAPSKTNQKVKSIDITMIAGNGYTNYLTLSELKLVHTDKVEVKEVTLDESNVTELYVSEVSPVKATVTTDPDAAANKYYTVESSDPAVANIITTGSESAISYLVHANKEGKTMITVTSTTDPTKKASYELNVKAGVSTTELMDAINKGNKVVASVYTEESYAELKAALEEATTLLQTEGYTKEQVSSATTKILTAITKLELKALDANQMINTEAAKAIVSIFAVSSEITGAEDGAANNVLDYDETTYWHTDYTKTEDLKMPHHITFDLGKQYDLDNVTFLPRPGATANGDILKAEVQISEDGKTFTSVGTFEFENNGRNLVSRDWQRAAFAKETGRYVKFIVLSAGGASKDVYASMSEIRFYGVEHEEEIVVDKSALLTAINDAGLLKEADYTSETWTNFANALQTAKDVYANEAATEIQVATALGDLRGAQNALEKKTPGIVDKVVLKAQIFAAEQLKQADYTTKTWENFAIALAQAKRVNSDENATVSQVSAAVNGLKTAMSNLEKLNDTPTENPQTGKEALRKLVNDAGVFVKDDYTADSWAMFAEALDHAGNVLSNEDATEEDIVAATQALEVGINGLIRVEKEPTPGTGEEQPGEEQPNEIKPGTDTSDKSNPGAIAGTMLLAGVAATYLVVKKKKEETDQD